MAKKSAAVKGFPDTWGQHRAVPFEHLGPASYPSGGEYIGAPQLGVSACAHVGSGVSYSGTYRVDCIYPGAGVRNAVYLKWSNASTGQEVGNGVNLSGETVRLLVVGG